MMATRSMSRSGSATTTSSKRKARSGQGVGSSAGKATFKAGAPTRPPVLGKRDANRQTRLTSVMRSTVPIQSRANPAHAGPSNPTPAAASSSRTPANNSIPSVIVLTSDDEDGEDEDILSHPGLPRPSEVNAGTKRKERDNDGGTAHAKGSKGKEKEKDSNAPFVNYLKADNEELKQKYAKKSKELERKEQDMIKVLHEKELLQLRLRELETQVLARRKSDAARAPPPDLSGVDDLISCQVCTSTMWHPATIRECGHTFCESCLHDWFKSTYEQHVTAYPDFVAGPFIPPEYHANRHAPRVAQAIKALVADWMRRVPQPKYTCPACRSNVKSKPIEVFFVKEAVSKMAKLMKDAGNEGSPAPRMNRTAGGIWDGFFPEAQL